MELLLEIQHFEDEDRLYDLLFWCPGCKQSHGVITREVDPTRLNERSLEIWEKNGRPKWTFDGNMKKPTFTPSIHVKDRDDGTMCHFFVRAGMIQFLDDCKHKLAGQTVPMENL